MAAIAAVVRFNREETLDLLAHCGWKSAGRWKNDRLAEKLKAVKEILTEDTEHPSDPAVAANLIKVLAAMEDGSTFEVVGEESGSPAEVEKGAETAPLKPVPEPVAEKPKAKPKAVAEPEPEPEPETEEAEPEPVAEKPKRGRKPKAAEPEPEVEAVAETEEAEPEAGAVQQSKTSVEVIDGLTAAAAEKLLGEKNVNNMTNRKFGAGLSKRYRNLMLTGGWDFGLRAHVIIDTDNQIQNTQHVLHALIAAEKERKAHPEKYPRCKGPIKLDAIVERGLNPRSANFIDIGKPRNHTDLVYRMRLVDGKYKEAEQATMAKWISTAARILYNRIELGKKVRSPDKFEHAYLVAVLDNNPGLIKSAEFIFSLDKNKDHAKCIKTLKVSPAYLVAAHYLAGQSVIENGDPMREEEADKFFTALAFGVDLKEGSPVAVLREWLLRNGGSKGNESLNRVYDALVIAWNASEKEATVTAKQLTGTKAAAYVEMGGLDTRPT